jgi:hypothetical protein
VVTVQDVLVDIVMMVDVGRVLFVIEDKNVTGGETVGE